MTAVKPARPRSAAKATSHTPSHATSNAPATTRSHRAGPHEVRIIGGQWKRTKLAVADAPGLRPTPDRVRETLFNWLGQDLGGWRCLDAFAGSGALGFEAASRGAAQATLLERDRRLADGLRQLQTRLAAQTVSVVCADALTWMRQAAPQSFELIFLDPPFDAGLFEPALQAARALLVADGLIYLEADRAFDAAAVQRFGLDVWRHAKAGAVHYHLLRPLAG